MKHEGPLPEEALPVGEESLTAEELDRVATFMFDYAQKRRERGGEPKQANYTLDQWAAIQKWKEGPNGLFATIRQMTIEERE